MSATAPIAAPITATLPPTFSLIVSATLVAASVASVASVASEWEEQQCADAFPFSSPSVPLIVPSALISRFHRVPPHIPAGGPPRPAHIFKACVLLRSRNYISFSAQLQPFLLTFCFGLFHSVKFVTSKCAFVSLIGLVLRLRRRIRRYLHFAIRRQLDILKLRFFNVVQVNLLRTVDNVDVARLAILAELVRVWLHAFVVDALGVTLNFVQIPDSRPLARTLSFLVNG